MPAKDRTALRIASYLLEIGAVKLQPAMPFKWASGWNSPIYCDNRISLAYPEVRTYIQKTLVKVIKKNFGKPDLIAGVATAGISQGTLVADSMKLPFAYVRSAPKDHGRENLIEGLVKKGQQAVVVEDLISTGQSSLKAVNALRDAGCKVSGMISVFTYGFKVADENFRNAKCPVASLCTYDELIEKAVETSYISEKDLVTLKEWREAPQDWKP